MSIMTIGLRHKRRQASAFIAFFSACLIALAALSIRPALAEGPALTNTPTLNDGSAANIKIHPKNDISAVAAKTPPKKTGLFNKDAPINLTADYLAYDKEADTYYARGNVVLVQELTTLRTNELLLNQSAGVATAIGRVDIVDEGVAALTGDNLQVDVDEKTAVIARGRLFFKKENVHISGEVLRKTDRLSYDAAKAVYTTCDCAEGESPAWSFRSKTATVTMGEYLYAYNAFFYVKDVPLFYFPVFTMPVKKERESGFLIPTPGYSKLRGFILDNSYFWAISRSTDATFYLDTMTNRGIGVGGEYRYVLGEKNAGEMYYYHFNESDIARVREFRSGANNLSRPDNATSDRWQLKYLHDGILADGTHVRANINMVSDSEYFIDFGKGQERSLESVESNVSVTKNWSVYSLVAQARWYNNLIAASNNATLQSLPEIDFNGGNRRILSTPLYYGFQSSLVNFWREEGTRGQRLDIAPRVLLPLNPGGYFDLVPSAGYRGTFYNADNDPAGRFFTRRLPDFNVDVTTTFVRVFQTNTAGIDALRNTLRPKLTYAYIPPVDQANMPVFDAVDNIAAKNALTYSLNTTLTGKTTEGTAKKYHDYIYLDISETYDINEAKRTLTPDYQKRKPFSNVTAELIFKPANWAKLREITQYDVYNNGVYSYDTTLEVTDGRNDTLAVTNKFIRGTSNYFEVNGRAHLTKTVDAIYTKRLSISDTAATTGAASGGSSLESVYGVEYKHQCYTALLTYTERPEEKVMYLLFTLKGLGKVFGMQI